jgi:hypothetical protein
MKLLPGTYSGGVGAPGTYTLSVYGPATISDGPSTSGGPGGLRLRNLTVMSGIGCSRQSDLVPQPSLDVEDVSITYDNSNGYPLSADDCQVRLERVTATVTTVNTGPAFYFGGSGGTGGSIVSMNRVRITAGDPGITIGDHSTLAITNSVFENQGPTYGAIQIAQNGSTTVTGTVAFSTFHNSLLKCPTGNLSLQFSNNIFFNEANGAPTNTVTGTECSHSYDLIKPQATAVGATNVLNVDPRFVNAAGSDYHLMMGSPAIDAADPAATLSSDYDGTTRPQGSARDVGAFEYKP